MTNEMVCPSCGSAHSALVHLTVEPARRAARRPVTPELLHLCPMCHALLILALHPTPQETSTL
jgi:hypothetical protein